MKIIYQQLIGFFVIIVIIISISGIAFSQLTKNFIYDDAWNNLENLSNTSIKRASSISEDGKNVYFNLDSLSSSNEFARSEKINFTVYDNDKNVIYTSNNDRKNKISSKNWQQLKQGKVIEKANDSKDSYLKKDSDSVIEVLKPYYSNGKLIAVVSASTFTSQLNDKISRINDQLIVVFLAAVIVGMIISFILANRLNKRIQKLRDSANKVSAGDYTVRLKSKNKDEIDDLINDFNEMTASLNRSDLEIKRQEERREEFLANAAHEMRTPLTTINGILEGFKYDVIPNNARDHSLELMMNETQRLIRLVNENLDYEKIRSNSINLQKSKFNSVSAIKNVVEQLNNKAQLHDDKIIMDFPEELFINADYDRFVQIMVNIITNSIQFTENGTIVISGKQIENKIVYKVADSGIGMTEDQVKNIFERYYKADSSRSEKFGESGLGLAIVHQLVDLHNGKIKVESTPGKGSTFTICFPDE